ncbi:hypothetical protein HGRIS_003478 [Hohenbuehelia grisea]|uniref:Methyltransferase domain-containing protein n=1 Tax=Hohenbuehelia grisea TaxID=104357 RepID=A0ABR3JFL5_9AGAR
MKTYGPVATGDVDVQAKLLNKRLRRRQSGDVPYPLQYSSDMLNYDIWDHMFLVGCCRRLSMHQLDVPPATVLDLGCGGGYWAMEAARHWKESIVIGYDIADIQPQLCALPGYQDLARRVKWVHGNLLDGLPFPTDHFDFVRISGIGLGVPEDEWQYVLEDVARVMKPGGILEVFEEDLIFPCMRPPKPRPPPITIDTVRANLSSPSVLSGQSSATLLSDPWSPYADSERQSTLSTLLESPRSISISPITPLSPSLPTIPKRPMTPDIERHPQDHSRLKAAWESMLSRRFLTSQLVSVLPFYLSSSFVDIQTHPTFQVPLPPNSRTLSLSRKTPADSSRPSMGDYFDPDQAFELKAPARRASVEREPDTTGKPGVKSSQRTIPSWAPMHLARTVNTIVACKEAIYAEYEALYGDDPSVPLSVRTMRSKDMQQAFAAAQAALSTRPRNARRQSAREGFDREWNHWYRDMEDRIGMRGRIASQCGWKETPGDMPDWRVWRKKMDKLAQQTNYTPSIRSSVSETPELCRSMRAFVGRKPLA